MDPIDPEVRANVTHVKFTAYCMQDENLVNYQFQFQPFAGLNTSRPIELSVESPGKYQLILPKSQTGMYWERLHDDNTLPIPGLRVWLEMKDKLNDTHAFIQEDEDDVSLVA